MPDTVWKPEPFCLLPPVRENKYAKVSKLLKRSQPIASHALAFILILTVSLLINNILPYVNDLLQETLNT